METKSRDIAVAVDIGGTKVGLAIVDVDGRLLVPDEKRLVPFDENNSADPNKLLEMIAPVIDQARSLPGRLRGIGLSICGIVDMETGMSVLSPNLHWRYVPFGEMVSRAFGLPVYAAPDTCNATLGEALWGAARGLRNFAWVTVGTGFGGFLFLDGKLYGGSHGFAGNFGHMTLDEVNGALCGCGRNGCFETFVAGPAIARAGQQAAERGESALLQSIAEARAITTRDVFDAEAARDPAACNIIDGVIRLLAINLGGLVNILDLDMLVLGGGVVQASPDFVTRIDSRIRSYLMSEEAIRELRIVKESFENSALMGTAVNVFVKQGILSL